MPEFDANTIGPAGLAELEAALAAAGLPTDDLSEPGRVFLRFEDGALVGYGGLEGAGVDRLLRSVVVVSGRRGTGLGARIVERLEAHAKDLGAARLHLLTTTAEPFFARMGYRRADRAAAPASIASSREFTSLCPATAVYLTKTVS